jgi:hypothetical protein
VPENNFLKIPLPLRVIKERGRFPAHRTPEFIVRIIKKDPSLFGDGSFNFPFLKKLSATCLLMWYNNGYYHIQKNEAENIAVI